MCNHIIFTISYNIYEFPVMIYNLYVAEKWNCQFYGCRIIHSFFLNSVLSFMLLVFCVIFYFPLLISIILQSLQRYYSSIGIILRSLIFLENKNFDGNDDENL